jgi:hypothetical protein
MATLVATLIMTLTSCQTSPREMLIGEYALTGSTTDLKMSQDDMQMRQMAMEDLQKKYRLVLSGDGKFEETINVTKKGTWEIYGDDGEEGEGWRLKLIFEDKSTVNMEIHDLSNSGFVNVIYDEASKSTTTNTYSKIK